MSKAAFFVVTYSIVIIVLFGVFCFLMTTVNPPPIVIEDKTEVSEKYKETNLANFYLRNMEPSEELEYGLEKADESPSPQSSLASYHQHVNLSNLIPTVKQRNPHLVKVYPPIWPPVTKTTVTSSKETKNIIKATMIANTTTKRIDKDSNTTSTDPTTKILESPIHRRSINAIERKLERDTGSVILKILDDDGQSRIEIKLSPNEIFEKKKSRTHRSSLKKDSKFSMVIEGNDKDVDINDLPENTEIRILPNDTVVIANDVNDLEGETVDFTKATYEYKTEKINDTHIYDTMYVDKENVTLLNFSLNTSTAELPPLINPTLDANKTSNIEQILYTVERKTDASISEIITEKTKVIINTTEVPEFMEKIDLNYTEILNTTKATLKEEMKVKTTDILITTTEVFGLKVMFDNVTKSFTEPYDELYVSENKTK